MITVTRLPLRLLLPLLLALVPAAHGQSVDLSGVAVPGTTPAASPPLAERPPSGAAPDGVTGGAPFGANLFTGGFSNDREDGLNPEYVLQPGDRVSVRIWGATEFNESLTIDPQGNVFLPSVGPIALAGTRNRDLNARVTRAGGDRVHRQRARLHQSRRLSTGRRVRHRSGREPGPLRRHSVELGAAFHRPRRRHRRHSRQLPRHPRAARRRDAARDRPLRLPAGRQARAGAVPRR